MTIVIALLISSCDGVLRVGKTQGDGVVTVKQKKITHQWIDMNGLGWRATGQTGGGWIDGLVDSSGSAGDGDRYTVVTRWPSD